MRVYLQKIPTSSRMQIKNSVWDDMNNARDICKYTIKGNINYKYLLAKNKFIKKK